MGFVSSPAPALLTNLTPGDLTELEGVTGGSEINGSDLLDCDLFAAPPTTPQVYQVSV